MLNSSKIVPGIDNSVAIELIATHIHRQLKERATRSRQKMAKAIPRELSLQASAPGIGEKKVHWENLFVLRQTPQLKVIGISCGILSNSPHAMDQGIYTILRNKDTSREDFIFFVDRLATFISEKALEHLPYRPKTVTTPVGVEYNGKEVDACVSFPPTSTHSNV